MEKNEMFRYNEAYQDLGMSPRPARKDFRPVGDFLDTILKNCGFEDSFNVPRPQFLSLVLLIWIS